MGVDREVITSTLEKFTGTQRRFDIMGETRNGMRIVDDYAHHPTEIHSTIQAAAGMDFKRVVLVFQPHTYSRTKELFGDFAAALADPALREVILTDIYPARETDTRGMSSELLAEAVRVRGGRCRAISSLDEIAASLHASCGRGDMILVMGAGDVSALCPRLLK
jgi:UDP-N-acetylmuramate--alanine ligase